MQTENIQTKAVLQRWCSEISSKFTGEHLMPKCDFHVDKKQLYRNHTFAWMFFCKFAAYFQISFS